MQRFTIAALAAVLIAAPALAAAAPLPTISVTLEGVNVQTDKGAKVALKRIGRAAREACASTPTGTRIRAVDHDCVNDLVAQAVQQLNAPRVTALHESKAEVRLADRNASAL